MRCRKRARSASSSPDRELSRLAAATTVPGGSGTSSPLGCFCALRAGTARGPIRSLRQPSSGAVGAGGCYSSVAARQGNLRGGKGQAHLAGRRMEGWTGLRFRGAKREEMKSEYRNPRSEGNPRPEIRMRTGPMDYDLAGNAVDSDLGFRPLGFGSRVCAATAAPPIIAKHPLASKCETDGGTAPGRPGHCPPCSELEWTCPVAG